MSEELRLAICTCSAMETEGWTQVTAMNARTVPHDAEFRLMVYSITPAAGGYVPVTTHAAGGGGAETAIVDRLRFRVSRVLAIDSLQMTDDTEDDDSEEDGEKVDSVAAGLLDPSRWFSAELDGYVLWRGSAMWYPAIRSCALSIQGKPKDTLFSYSESQYITLLYRSPLPYLLK